jgi:hypothetical protein
MVIWKKLRYRKDIRPPPTIFFCKIIADGDVELWWNIFVAVETTNTRWIHHLAVVHYQQSEEAVTDWWCSRNSRDKILNSIYSEQGTTRKFNGYCKFTSIGKSMKNNRRSERERGDTMIFWWGKGKCANSVFPFKDFCFSFLFTFCATTHRDVVMPRIQGAGTVSA